MKKVTPFCAPMITINCKTWKNPLALLQCGDKRVNVSRAGGPYLNLLSTSCLRQKIVRFHIGFRGWKELRRRPYCVMCRTFFCHLEFPKVFTLTQITQFLIASHYRQALEKSALKVFQTLFFFIRSTEFF